MSSYVQLQFVIKFPIAPDDHPEPKPRIDPPSLAFQCERRTRSHEQQPQQERGVPRRLQRRRLHRCGHKGARSVRARSHPAIRPPTNPRRIHFRRPDKPISLTPPSPFTINRRSPCPTPSRKPSTRGSTAGSSSPTRRRPAPTAPRCEDRLPRANKIPRFERVPELAQKSRCSPLQTPSPTVSHPSLPTPPPPAPRGLPR